MTDILIDFDAFAIGYTDETIEELSNGKGEDDEQQFSC